MTTQKKYDIGPNSYYEPNMNEDDSSDEDWFDSKIRGKKFIQFDTIKRENESLRRQINKIKCEKELWKNKFDKIKREKESLQRKYDTMKQKNEFLVEPTRRAVNSYQDNIFQLRYSNLPM